VLEAEGYTVVLPVTIKVVNERIKPSELDEALLKKIGEMALASVGYDEIMKRAEEQGWVKRVPVKQARSATSKQFVADGPMPVNIGEILIESTKLVLTKTAPVAVVISQADTPAPGPGDILAVGIFFASLVAAGGISVYIYVSNHPSPTPTTQPQPPPAPTPQVPPLNCPRNEKFVPERTDNSMGCTDKKGNIRCYSRKHPPCAGVHTHGMLHYQEIRRGLCTEVAKEAVRCEGPFIVSGPCGSVSTVECRDGGPETSGIFVEK
jgi:hypothetical protein